MDLEQLKILCAKGEKKSVEYKSSTAHLRAAFETICAFLNSKGGTVLIGVRDDGRILGQDISDNTRREIAREIRRIEPAAPIEIEYVDLENNKVAIAIHAGVGTHAPYTYDGRAWQRDESETNRMSQHLYEQLLVKRDQFNHTWEDFIANDYDTAELDHDEIYKAVMDGIAEKRIPAGIAKESVEKILRQLNLLVDGKPKRAAIALFGNYIKSGYRQCWLKMARFEGTDKLGNFMDNQQKHCNVFHMLEEADHFFRKHLHIASSFKPDQFKRSDKPTLPVLAIREALVNAICHRDYAERAGYISIAIFDDRVEIWNNGTLPTKLKLEDLKRKHDSILKNELIAEIFYLRGYIEAWGTGTTRMIAFCKKDMIPAPQFSERTGGFLVTFPFAKSIGTSPIHKQQVLNARQNEIIQLLNEHAQLNTKDIFALLKIKASLRTVSADLSLLKKEGFVEQQGSGRGTSWKRAN